MTSISARAATAPLDDPRYYLANFRFVLDWVAKRHADLLATPERAFLEAFMALPEASQALLVRMVMRRGEHFRTSRLVYAEIGDTETALAPLVEADFVDADPALDIATLFAQLRLPELRQALAGEIAAAELSPGLSKAALNAALAPRLDDSRRLTDWWPAAPDRVVRLAVMATCDRLRLMFFGNLRQDWAEFVLAELGVQRFESVTFTHDSRAFRSRREVDAYLALHRLRERLDAGESAAELKAELPEMPANNAWLMAHRDRLCLALGRQAEREGEVELALSLYAEAGWNEGASSEARIRRLRLLERQGRHAEALALARPLVQDSQACTGAEAQALDRLLPRLARRLGEPVAPRLPEPVPERFTLELDPMGASLGVERAVADHLHRDAAPVYYVENALINGLFGLLCWEALFAPLPGAFFHPFHVAPADLYREDFVTRRRAHFAACLALLDDDSHAAAIRATWREKRGLASPFVHWETLDEALIELALACVPAAHLRACFERLLGDLKGNRAGLPDLVQFRPQAAAGEPRYRLIEVKGPGDRLQDNQRRWLSFFIAQDMPAAVCHVRWWGMS
ncbi:VRR-NUC domain-containing protein [Billgrantia gudaonensis]|uniref:phosphodiesterase I n=1 Tax=Billgrantia gudaonensis TaxID=376427 RepID=A0A1G9A0X1_9GAMM|nr:VRR-NUC domain-containing protein [Halomonas gudaonensis]SDK21029.1 VRR-NUC domain-containing protein [Halomonas gudaonensis]